MKKLGKDQLRIILLGFPDLKKISKERLYQINDMNYLTRLLFGTFDSADRVLIGKRIAKILPIVLREVERMKDLLRWRIAISSFYYLSDELSSSDKLLEAEIEKQLSGVLSKINIENVPEWFVQMVQFPGLIPSSLGSEFDKLVQKLLKDITSDVS